MTVAIITGSAGLIGSEAVAHFADKGLDIVGIDNDMRRVFFSDEAIFERHGRAVGLVVHTAAQPSHDWAVRDPLTDFDRWRPA